MANLFKLPTWTGKRDVHAIVETPRSARAKLSYDPKLRAFVLSMQTFLNIAVWVWERLCGTSLPLDHIEVHESPGCWVVYRGP